MADKPGKHLAQRRKSGPDPLLSLSALELRDRLARGAVRAVEYVEACLAWIAEREPAVQAWAYLDGDDVLAQAARLDKQRTSGRTIGPLHGVPVALKDIIDTARIPTENGTDLDKGRVPAADAFVVAKLRAAGAIIMGKTVTTEMAYMHPGKTRNPHDPDHTPGGSSSGSAAAVAAGMVPLAVGTQTGGSVIRPASYCGVTGFKPSFGAVPRSGILMQSPSLDTVGVFARSTEDAALLAEVLFGDDAADTATRPAPAPRLLDTARSNPPVTPTLALVWPPHMDQADPETRAAIQELAEALGEQCFEAPLPAIFDEAEDARARINFAEMSKHYYAYEKRGRDALSDDMRDAIDRGKLIPARDYLSALDYPGILNSALAEIFARCDAILTVAAAGPALRGLGSTGKATYNGLWTLCGTPAISLPLLSAQNGLPMGVQLVARHGDDARLLRTARWLEIHVKSMTTEE